MWEIMCANHNQRHIYVTIDRLYYKDFGVKTIVL